VVSGDPARVRVAVVDADDELRGALMLEFAQHEEHFTLLPGMARPLSVPPDLGRAIVVIDPAPRGRFEESWIEELRLRVPDALVIVYTHGFDPVRLAAVVAAKAHGYLLKEHVTASEVVLAAEWVGRMGRSHRRLRGGPGNPRPLPSPAWPPEPLAFAAPAPHRD